MTSIINLFKKTLKFPVLWVGLINLFWLMLIPTDEFFDEGIRLLIIYFVITVLETLLSGNKILSIVLLIVLLPIAWIAGIFVMQIWFEAGWQHRQFIYVPLIILLSGYNAYNLFQRPSRDNKTVRILLFIATFPILALNVAHQVVYFPEVQDQKEFGNLKYYIVWQLDVDYHDYVSFYKCEKWSFSCNVLTSHYSGPGLDKIIIDKEKNEVSALGPAEFGLAFTDGDHPRAYELGYPEQLGNHVYQLAINSREIRNCMAVVPSCNSYTYTLYECNLDYTSCDPLPVQYTTTDDNEFFLDANEVAGEINASDYNDTLIFTYGAHPVCYVDQCVILDH